MRNVKLFVEIVTTGRGTVFPCRLVQRRGVGEPPGRAMRPEPTRAAQLPRRGSDIREGESPAKVKESGWRCGYPGAGASRRSRGPSARWSVARGPAAPRGLLMRGEALAEGDRRQSWTREGASRLRVPAGGICSAESQSFPQAPAGSDRGRLGHPAASGARSGAMPMLPLSLPLQCGGEGQMKGARELHPSCRSA